MTEGHGRLRRFFYLLRRLPGTILSVLLGAIILAVSAPLSAIIIFGVV